MLCPFTLQRTNFLRIRGCSFKKFFLSTFQRTEICRLLSMPVRKFFLREPVSAQVIFKTLRSDRACKALSLGEVAAAVRLRIAGFGEGTPQQDSDGTEWAKCEIWHLGRILLSAAPNLPSLYNGHFFSKKQGCICKHFVNKLPPPAVRRCNSFCFYGIAAAMGLRHANGNIGVTISNIRPECFSFSLPLLQFQKRFLASFQKIVLQDEKRTVCMANRS